MTLHLTLIPCTPSNCFILNHIYIQSQNSFTRSHTDCKTATCNNTSFSLIFNVFVMYIHVYATQNFTLEAPKTCRSYKKHMLVE